MEAASRLREFAGALLLLGAALAAALTSALARENGQAYAAIFLALVALILAVVVGGTLIPRILSRINSELLNSIRYFRITRRGAFVLVLLFLIGMATFNTGNNLLVLVLSVLLAALIVSGIASNLVLHGLNIRLNLPDTIHAGQTAVFFLTLENMKRRLPSFALRLKARPAREEYAADGAADFFSREAIFPYLSPESRLTARLEGAFSRRGRYVLEGFQVTTDFPFGFFTRGRHIPTEGSITVYPAPVALGELFRRQPRLQGLEALHQKGSGSGLFNIRDYQQGDSARSVHWKSSAKASRLMVREHIQEEDHPFEIVFSTFLPNRDSASLEQFERAVSYLASLVTQYRECTVALRFRSGEFRTDADGPGDFEEIMGYLACVEPSPKRLVDEATVDSRSVLFLAGPSDRIWAVDYLSL